MSPAARVRRAMGTTLAVHFVGLMLASALALGLERSLAASAGHLVGGVDAILEPGGALLVESLSAWKRTYALGFLELLLVVLGVALFLAPWLQMSWLAALDDERGVGASLRLGAARYVRATLLFLLQALAAAPLLLLSGLAPVGVHFVLAETPWIPLHDLAVVAALLPSLATALLAGCWVDLGRVALVAPGVGVFRAARQSLSMLRPRLALAFIGWLTLGQAMMLGANALSALPMESPTALALTLATAQSLLLGRTLAQARWLAAAIDARRPPLR